MIELITGRSYIVGHVVTGLFVGRFTGIDKHGALQFADVTEFADVAKGEQYTVTPTGIVDAEPWTQTMELVNYAEVHEANRVARDMVHRKSFNVPRCKKVAVDTE